MADFTLNTGLNTRLLNFVSPSNLRLRSREDFFHSRLQYLHSQRPINVRISIYNFESRIEYGHSDKKIKNSVKKISVSSVYYCGNRVLRAAFES